MGYRPAVGIWLTEYVFAAGIELPQPEVAGKRWGPQVVEGGAGLFHADP